MHPPSQHDGGRVPVVVLAPTRLLRDGVEAVLETAATTWLLGTRAEQSRPSAARSRWLTPDAARALYDPKRFSLAAEALAENPRTPADVILSLTDNPSTAVRQAARRHPACPWSAVPGGRSADRLHHLDCPAELLTRAANPGPFSQVSRAGTERRAVALAHPNLDPAQRARAVARCSHHDAGVLLTNPALTHAEARTVLARSTGLAWVWAGHANADADWLADLARRAAQEDDHGLFAHPARTLGRIAANPATPGHTLYALAQQFPATPPLTANIYANPSCPTNLLRDTADPHGPLFSPGWRANTVRWIERHPNADLSVLAHLAVSPLSGEDLFDFVAVHATSAAHARTLLGLAPVWTGTLADLVTTAAAVIVPAGGGAPWT